MSIWKPGDQPSADPALREAIAACAETSGGKPGMLQVPEIVAALRSP
jgi:hypothetical protein